MNDSHISFNVQSDAKKDIWNQSPLIVTLDPNKIWIWIL